MPATDWESWSSCSTTCDSGIQTRTRTCAYNQGSSTHESKLDIQACNVQNCCGEWGSWGDCSKTCGVGIKHKTKTCFAGIKYSNYKDCIIPATDWSSWSDCSRTCGQGSTDRKVGPLGPSDPFRSADRTGRGPAKFLKKRTGADHGPRKI